MSDDEFITGLKHSCNALERKIVLVTRQVLSKMAGIEPEAISHQMKPADIVRLLPEWDPILVVLGLEEQLNIELTADDSELPSLVGERILWWHLRDAPATFGDWTVDVAKWVSGQIGNVHDIPS